LGNFLPFPPTSKKLKGLGGGGFTPPRGVFLKRGGTVFSGKTRGFFQTGVFLDFWEKILIFCFLKKNIIKKTIFFKR